MERAASSFPKKKNYTARGKQQEQGKGRACVMEPGPQEGLPGLSILRGFSSLNNSMFVCLSVFTAGLSSTPYRDPLLSVNRTRANPRNAEEFQRGCAWLCDGSTAPAGNQAQAMLRGRGGQKRGVWAERAAGNLQENLLAGNVMNTIAEEKQAGSCCWEDLPRKRSQAEGGVNLSEISLSLLSSPGFKKQIFCHIEVATSSGGCAPCVCSVRKDEPWLRSVTDTQPSVGLLLIQSIWQFAPFIQLESTCHCLQNTEFCLIQRCLSLAFSIPKDTMDYSEDEEKAVDKPLVCMFVPFEPLTASCSYS